MAKYKDKWKTTFPASIGNQTRPEDGVDNTQEYNTDGLPQYMANDPVRYDLQNAVNSQLVSNDERLNEKIKRTSDDLAAHNKDPKAHVTGIAGNAATASKLLTPRTISLTGKAAGSTSFDGSSNAAINVTSVNADTASKLSTARKINITGNATGSANFDGSGNVSINTTVSQAAHADRATADANGNELANAQKYMHVYDLPNNTDFNNVKTTGIYTCTQDSYTNRPYAAWGVLRVYWFNNNVKQEYVPDNRYDVYERYFTGGTWNAWSKVNAANADTATKLATARAISLTGNASGSANFDGSGNISINTTVNESKHAVNADTATNANHAGTADKATTANTATNASHATSADSAADVTNATVSPGISNIDGVTVPASGVINYLSTVTGSNDLTSTNKLRSYIGSIYNGNWYEAISIRHRNGNQDGTNYGLLMYSNLTDNWDTIHYKKQCNDWTEERTLLDSANYNSFAPTKTGGGASGTWGINISGNAASATDADKLDGYHASDIISKIYPVGSIYMSMSATNPHDLFGVGTWQRISQGRMLIGADDSTYKAGATGGEATHTLTAAEMPAHSHGISTSGDHSHYFYGSDNNNGPFTEGDGLDTEANGHFTRNVRFTTSSAGAHTHTISNSGGGAAHNNMPPYLVCYIWQRTA